MPFAGDNDPVNSFDPFVVIRDPDGTIVHTEATTGSESFYYIATSRGLHTIQVDSQANSSGEYALHSSLAPLDFGDAPDTSAGAATGNYQTLLSDNGPAHVVIPGLFLGGAIDGDNGVLENVTANADGHRSSPSGRRGRAEPPRALTYRLPLARVPR